MREVTVFTGGSVGSDPYSEKTWSGSSKALLEAMTEGELLDKAVGIDLSKLGKYLLLAKNFNRNRTVWRNHFYLDPAYRNALTAAAGKATAKSPVLLQIGAQFCLPEVFAGKTCISYQDGNLAMRQRSGFGMKGVSAKRIDQALRYEEETARQLNAVFTFSEYLRQSFIRDYHVPAEKVFNVGGAINLTTGPEIDPAKDYGSRRILFIGREFKRKGGPQLLEAFRIVRERMPDAQLHIVGPASLESVPGGVTWHGHLSKADPAQKLKLEGLFRDCSLFAMPSLYEPFGIAPLEAMLYGLPCVVTDDWALRECVRPGVNGALVQKGSIEDLAEKMYDLLADPAGLAAMGVQGRERVLEQYTWRAVVARMAQAMPQAALRAG